MDVAGAALIIELKQERMSKKLLALVALTLTVLTSSRYVAPSDGRVGHQAPSLRLQGDSSTVSLHQLRGQRVVVTFWSSANPTSRLAVKQHEQLASASGGELHHLAVNMDRSEGLFHQLVAADQLNSSNQFFVEPNEQEKLLASWRLHQDALGAFFISPEGEIESIETY